MPEKKVINSAVRLDEAVDRGEGKAVGHGTRTFGPGQEEDLAKAANKKQLQHLTDQGAIAGFGPKPTKGSPADLADVTIFQPDEGASAPASGSGAPPAGGTTPPAGGAPVGGPAAGTGAGAPPAGGTTPPAGGQQ